MSNYRVSLGAALACAGLLLAACSSAPGSSTPPKATGTVNVMVFGLFSALGPEQVEAAHAMQSFINSSGGMNGRRINVNTCEDLGTASSEVQCAETAISQHDAAVIVGISVTGGPAALPILQPAHIPWIVPLPTTNIEFSNPDSFPLTGGSSSQYPSEGAYLAKSGCKKVGIIHEEGGIVQEDANLIAAGAEVGGAKVVAQQTITTTEPDVAPAVQALLQAGAKCIGEAIAPTDSIKVLNAISQSSDPSILQVSATAQLPAQLAQVLGSKANGVIDLTPAYDPTAPQESQLSHIMQQYGPKSVTTFSQNVWAGLEYFDAIVSSISGQVTGSAVANEIRLHAPVKLAAFPDAVSFKTLLSDPSFARVVNTSQLVYKVENGQLVLEPGVIINGAAGLKKYEQTYKA